MTITRKDVEGFIKDFSSRIEDSKRRNEHPSWGRRDNEKILTLLKSVLENGLSLSQKEIEEIIRKEWDSICPLPHSFAHAIHGAQMKGIGE